MNETKELPIGKIELNTGQVEGLPKNPRFIRDDRYKALVKSIKDAPEMLHLRELLVYPHGDKYVVIGGNMRLRACRELGFSELPCKVLPTDTPAAKLREYAIKDNNGFGQDDWDLLANEWEAEELTDWGMELPSDWGELEEEDEDEPIRDDEKNEEAERLLDEAMLRNQMEFKEQFDKCFPIFPIGYTQGWAEAQFIKAKYYGRKMPQSVSLYFTPERWLTPTHKSKSTYYDCLTGRHAGYRTATDDGLLSKLYSSSYPIAASAAAAADFPIDIAQRIYEQYAKGRDVLDPCHGWGGRLMGAMLADVHRYVGIDPSPVAHKGVSKIVAAFSKYSMTSVELIERPFEDVELQAESFDFALTSPPYFNVEKYAGEQTSTTRYPKFEAWITGFYRPLIERTFVALRGGGVFCLQVGSQFYPLQNIGKEIAESVGFVVESVEPLVNKINGGLSASAHPESEKGEKIITLRK